MKKVIISIVFLLTANVHSFEILKDFRFEVKDMVLKGTQHAKEFHRHITPEELFNVGFSTSIKEIEFTGKKAIALRDSLLSQPETLNNQYMAKAVYKTNYAARGEEVTVSCQLISDHCLMSYYSPKTGRHSEGLVGSNRLNSFDISTLEEAVEKARNHFPIIDFVSASNLALTNITELELKIDRKPLEKLFSEAGLCENRFFSGGGVYGPGNNICFMNILL